MKNMLIFIFCCLVIELNAQQGPFIRVYNSNNQKFQKGYLHKTSDSGLILMRKGVLSQEIRYDKIQVIKFKRSAGHIVALSGGVPVVTGIILGGILKNSKGGGFPGIFIFLSGLISGPTFGGIKAITNPKPMIIGGNQENWINYKRLLDQKLK
ncbi:MAG: hypothetical protein ACKOBX_06285 [Bacteroidota bacterium]